jgi:nucleotide-binding universal stress UspA family protein
MTTAKIVVGVDGSPHSRRAVEWCARYASALGAEVVAVHASEIPFYFQPETIVPLPSLTPKQREEISDVITRDWCKPLADLGVHYQVMLVDGSASHAIMEAARAESAELIVVGRRGRGGFAELVLGSTSHQLSHHATRPLVIVP